MTPSAQTCGSRPGAEVELADRRAGQVTPRALGEHGRLRGDVRARLEVPERLAVAAAALVARADAAHDAVLDEQLLGGRLREDVGARLLGALGQPARQLGDRDDVVAVVRNGGGVGLSGSARARAEHPVARPRLATCP